MIKKQKREEEKKKKKGRKKKKAGQQGRTTDECDIWFFYSLITSRYTHATYLPPRKIYGLTACHFLSVG